MLLFPPQLLGPAAIWCEAEGQSQRGKIMVGEVIRKRTRLHYMSDGTVAGTVALRFQFSALNDDPVNNARLIKMLQLDDNDPAYRDSEQAWGESILTDYSRGALLYYNPKAVTKEPSWKPKSRLVAVEGDHEFYIPLDMVGVK